MISLVRKSFLSNYKNIILTFSLSRTDFLSSNRNIQLIFSLVKAPFSLRYKYSFNFLSSPHTLFGQPIKTLFQCFFQSEQLFLLSYKNMILSFCLVRNASFPKSQKQIFLQIFFLVRTAFLSRYKTIVNFQSN